MFPGKTQRLSQMLPPEVYASLSKEDKVAVQLDLKDGFAAFKRMRDTGKVCEASVFALMSTPVKYLFLTDLPMSEDFLRRLATFDSNTLDLMHTYMAGGNSQTGEVYWDQLLCTVQAVCQNPSMTGSLAGELFARLVDENPYGTDEVEPVGLFLYGWFDKWSPEKAGSDALRVVLAYATLESVDGRTLRKLRGMIARAEEREGKVVS